MPPIEIGTRGGRDLRSGDPKREEGPPDRRLGWSLSEVCHIPKFHGVKLCESAVRRDLSPLI